MKRVVDYAKSRSEFKIRVKSDGFSASIKQKLKLRSMEDKGFAVYARFIPESSFNITYFGEYVSKWNHILNNSARGISKTVISVVPNES